MRGRSSIYAFYGIIPVHISRDVCSEEVGASHHRRPAMRPGVVLRILHSACGSVYADKQRLHSRMTKEGLRSGQSRTRIDRVGPAPGMTEQDLSEGLWQRV